MKNNKKILSQFIGFVVLVLLGGVLSPVPALAWDTQPDANGKYDGEYDRPTYFPTWHQPTTWPNVMIYLCEVRLGKAEGDRLSNYEIAVYDQNNQLRSCCRSKADDNDLCVLTIRGTEGDTFHFKVIYGSNFAQPFVMDVPAVTVSFQTNLVQGSATNPYLLVSPMMGDVNDNGLIDIGDAVCVVNRIVNKQNTTFKQERADLNHNSGVDIGDAVMIVNHLVGKQLIQ